MNPGGDKMVTTQRDGPPAISSRSKKKGKPVAVVKFGSASVPVYRLSEKQRTRFAIAHYRDGKRRRQVFSSLDAAKKEAQLVAMWNIIKEQRPANISYPSSAAAVVFGVHL